MKKTLLKLVMAFLTFCSFSISQTNYWEKINGLFGCEITSMTISPNNTLFVGAKDGGLYLSTNNGDLWIQTSLATPTIYSICLNSNGKIFAGADSGKIYQSSDNGSNWTMTRISTVYKISSIAINSTGFVFVGTEGNGVFISKNNGISWEPWNVSKYGPCYTITCTTKGEIYVSIDNYLYSSSDNGNSWTKIYQASSTIASLVINQNGNIFIYSTDVSKSTDNGKTWTNTNFGNVVRSFATNLSGHIFISSADGVYRSMNNGSTWAKTTLSFTGYQNGYIVINSSGSIFASSSEGVFISTDNGLSWNKKNSGLANTKISSLTTNSSGNIYIGITTPYHNIGLYRSINNGINWEKTTGPGAISLAIDPLNSLIFAGEVNNGISLSKDNGNTWKSSEWKFVFRDPYKNNNVRPNVKKIIVNSKGHIFASADYRNPYGSWDPGWYISDIFRSTDNGISWEELPFRFNSGSDRYYNKVISSIEISSNGDLYSSICDGYSFLGSNYYTGDLYRSTDNGQTWMQTGLTNNGVLSIGISSNGHIFSCTSDGLLYKSTDNSYTWSQIGSTNYYFKSFIFNSIGYIFGITNNNDGVYISTDNGYNWKKLNSGLTDLRINAISINKDGYVFLGTDGNGIFKSLKPTTSVNENNKIELTGFALSQNYPNPFNPSTNIKYSIPKECNVLLKVFDALGQEVKTLVDINQSAGNYEIIFVTEKLSSGLYFYQLRAGKFAETKKMLLLR